MTQSMDTAMMGEILGGVGIWGVSRKATTAVARTVSKLNLALY
jgi:hypothetical protein